MSSTCDTNGYKNIPTEEIQIPVPWGHISGKWWGDKDVQPILAIHGWQDNACTFDTLIPMMYEGTPILSIDLPGHGFSSHLPEGAFYYIFWDGLIFLRRIVTYYKWSKVKILGHSLGGAIGFLYAATFPDEVEMLICLDIVSPSVRNISRTVSMSGDFIDKFLKYETHTLDSAPSYDYDDMISIVVDAYNGGITRESAEILMKRGMQPGPIPGKHLFSRDIRLKTSILGMFTTDLTSEYASRIKCAYLNIRAIPGLKIEYPQHYQNILDIIKGSAKPFEYHEIEGSHHVHLNEPEKVAPIIKEFIRKNK